MLKAENEVVVAASIAAAWAAVIRFEEYTFWHPHVLIKGVAERDANVDYSLLARPGGSTRWNVDGRITMLNPERQLTIELGWRRLGFQESYLFSSIPNGTRINHSLSFGGILGMFALAAVKRNLAKRLAFEDRRLIQYILAQSKPNRSNRRGVAKRRP